MSKQDKRTVVARVSIGEESCGDGHGALIIEYVERAERPPYFRLFASNGFLPDGSSEKIYNTIGAAFTRFRELMDDLVDEEIGDWA